LSVANKSPSQQILDCYAPKNPQVERFFFLAQQQGYDQNEKKYEKKYGSQVDDLEQAHKPTRSQQAHEKSTCPQAHEPKEVNMF
jgi:hypothetical protein